MGSLMTRSPGGRQGRGRRCEAPGGPPGRGSWARAGPGISPWRFPPGVGKNWRITGPGSGLTVHPQVRGDNDEPVIENLRYYGSPPGAWGQPDVAHPTKTGHRFTPTCVGTTPGWCGPARQGPPREQTQLAVAFFPSCRLVVFLSGTRSRPGGSRQPQAVEPSPFHARKVRSRRWPAAMQGVIPSATGWLSGSGPCSPRAGYLPAAGPQVRLRELFQEPGCREFPLSGGADAGRV